MKYHVSFNLEFLKNTNKGTFIAIEGIDGSGKSTQVKILKKYYTKRKKAVITTHEPTRSGHVGKLIHNILQSKVKVPASSLQHLFAADRSIHQQEIVIPNLKLGSYVISERCFWSSLPYGLADKNISDYNNSLNVLLSAYGLLSMYNQFVVPDYTFFLDIPVKESVKRLGLMDKQKEIYEKKEKLDLIYKGYQFLLAKFPKEFVVIDGIQSEEKITKQITDYLNI